MYCATALLGSGGLLHCPGCRPHKADLTQYIPNNNIGNTTHQLNRIPENYLQSCCGLLVASRAKRLCTKQTLLISILRIGRLDGAAGCWDNRTAPLTSHYNYKSLNTKEVPTALTCERGGCTSSQHCRAFESKNIAIGFIRIQFSKV